MVIVPSFVLWDYTFRPAGIFTKDKALCRGVRSEEVSVGYSRKWKAQWARSSWLREVLPGVPNRDSEEA